jgi:hypothetical protein
MLAGVQLQYSQSLPWVLVLLLGLSLLALWVYPGQVREMPRGLVWLLPTLRILAVGAIGFSILRPVVTRPRVGGERPPVVVLFDDSASMGVVDVDRAPAEWVAIAAALGRLPADERDRQLDAAQADCDRLASQADDVQRARAELDYARLAGRGIETAQTRLDQAIDLLQNTARETAQASGSIHSGALDKAVAYLTRIPAGVERDAWLDRIRDRARNAALFAEQARVASDGAIYRSDPQVRRVCEPLQRLCRLDLCETAMLDSASGLLPKLESSSPVQGYSVSDQVTPLDLHAMQPGSLPADGTLSNFTGAMRLVLQSLKSDPPRAIVLFSDGRAVGADLDASTLASLQGVPIFTVGAAVHSGLKDLSIVSAITQSEATVGEKIAFTVEVRCVGMRGVSTSVKVTGGGAEETREAAFADERPVSLVFERQFSRPGLQAITLQVQAVPGEASTENNRVQRWVNVSAVTPEHSRATTRPATRPSLENELADLTGDEAQLRRLSDASGGQYFRLDQVDLLPRRLAELPDDANHPIEIPLWDSPFLYALVLGCLTTEWGVRKRYGLA